MKISYIFVILTLFSKSLFGQDVQNDNNLLKEFEILKTDTLTKGIYLIFKEFQQNNPALKVDYIISDKPQPLYHVINKLQYKKMYVSDSNNNLVEFKERHWGICDGKKTFINYNGKYFDLSLDGKYCEFSDSPSYNQFYNFPTSGSSSYQLPSIEYNDYLLNITNGEILPVEVYTVKELLKNENTALFMEFKKDKDKKLMLYDYINRLNKSFSYK